MATPETVPPGDAAEEKYRRLVESIRELGSVLVAFSGGVDSSLLLAAALAALPGGRVRAATSRSASMPSEEYAAATAVASQLGASMLVLDAGELDEAAYRENSTDRCYVCKTIIFGRLLEVARREGLAHVIEGSNVDDGADFRPGRRALAELAVLSPLREAGLTKAEIRELARRQGLPNWDKPSLACLASRVPFGQPITAERLLRIDRAEAALRKLGFRQLRVRDHGEVARIELEVGELERATAPGLREQLVAAVAGAGFRYASLDLVGYRQGSLNPAP